MNKHDWMTLKTVKRNLKAARRKFHAALRMRSTTEFSRAHNNYKFASALLDTMQSPAPAWMLRMEARVTALKQDTFYVMRAEQEQSGGRTWRARNR